jgi:hypothetical protein
LTAKGEEKLAGICGNRLGTSRRLAISFRIAIGAVDVNVYKAREELRLW